MALNRIAQVPQASTSNAAGATTPGAAQTVGYGVSGVATITNGATPPTVACDFIVDVSSDGGSTWFEWSRQTTGLTALAAYRFAFALAPGGQGGDYGHYRTRFSGNTAQAVTVSADASMTTSY